MGSLKGDPNTHAVAEFANGITGSCLCGSIRVTIHDSELFTRRRGHVCHCANCRKVSGSFAAANFAIEASKVEIQDASGTLKTYHDYDTLSGNPVVRSFCSVDGNPIKSETSLSPGQVILKLGLFPRIPQPEMESFVIHRHPWEVDIPGAIKFKVVRNGERQEE